MTRRFSRLDRDAIRRMKPGERLTEYGITAERLPDGDVRYEINVMVDGRRIHRVIGRESEGVTRTQAEEFIEQARTDARHSRLGLPQGRKLALLFTEAADNYLKRLEDSGGKNISRKRHHLNKKLKPFFSAMRLDAISDFTTGRYKKRRAEEGAATGTVNRELATFSHLLRKAVEWKRPCAGQNRERTRGTGTHHCPDRRRERGTA